MKIRLLLPVLTLSFTPASTMSAASQLMFIGTYTPKDGASKGIYAVSLNESIDLPAVAAFVALAARTGAAA